jgi:hypothetical protein
MPRTKAQEEREKEIEQIMKNNPAISADRIAEALEIIQALRLYGVQRAEYSLTSPYARKSSAKSSDMKNRSGRKTR